MVVSQSNPQLHHLPKTFAYLPKTFAYHLKHILVKSYQGEKYPKQGASFEQLEDIDTVATDDVNTCEQITNSEIAGVISFDDFLLCLICKNKVQPSDDQFGSCTECNTVQKINLCLLMTITPAQAIPI